MQRTAPQALVMPGLTFCLSVHGMQVALAAGKRTAWFDKGPYYELVQVWLGLLLAYWSLSVSYI